VQGCAGIAQVNTYGGEGPLAERDGVCGTVIQAQHTVERRRGPHAPGDTAARRHGRSSGCSARRTPHFPPRVTHAAGTTRSRPKSRSSRIGPSAPVRMPRWWRGRTRDEGAAASGDGEVGAQSAEDGHDVVAVHGNGELSHGPDQTVQPFKSRRRGRAGLAWSVPSAVPAR
jgi:hypothetical protein